MDSDAPDAAPREGAPRDGQSQRVVKLSVGGARFQTTLGTLRRFPGTFLEAMFSGRFPRVTDDEGWHFIDRDGTHFRHILNFLREPSHFECEASPGELRELRREVVDPGGAPARPPLPRPQSDENFDETGSVGEAWAAAVRDGARPPAVGALRG